MYSTALQGGPGAAGMRRRAAIREDSPDAALRADVAAVTKRRSDRCSHLCLGVLHQRWG
jgi:hypothetical protein